MSDDVRLAWIAERLLEAMREVVRECAISEDELHAAGAYLNRIGQDRLFPSLLDIALAMTSIDVTRLVPGSTRRNLEGPMYRPGAPIRLDGCLLERPPSPDAALLTLSGRVTDAVTGVPIAGAEVDVWQPDEQGVYDQVGFNLRGVVRTTETGHYRVQTILPSDYAQHADDIIGDLLGKLGMSNYRAAHIHVKVRVDGDERITTQFFRADSPFLARDYVVGAVSDDLVVEIRPVQGTAGTMEYAMTFDIAVPPAVVPS